MLELVLGIIIIFVVVVALYYGVCHIIRIWTGCDFEEAVVKLHNYFNGTTLCCMENDPNIVDNMWYIVSKIISEQNFNKLKKLSEITNDVPLLSFECKNGLRYMCICVPYNNDVEKQQLQNILSQTLKKYLRKYGHSDTIFVRWGNHNTLSIPYLCIMYSTNKIERQKLNEMIAIEVEQLQLQNTVIVDDEDTEVLYDDENNVGI